MAPNAWDFFGLCSAPNDHTFWVLGVWNRWKSSRHDVDKCHGFPRARLPFLTHNMARPPKNMLATAFRVSRREIGEKMGGATLSGRTLCVSIGATWRAIRLFLPHNMAAERGQHLTGKKGKKGHATLCGRTFYALRLYLQRLRRSSRHIIWRESATI